MRKLKLYDGDSHSGRVYAKVRLCVDFPDAENVYVVFVPVYETENLADAIDKAKSWMLNSFVREAREKSS